jgi:hypothetical protein
MDMAPVHKRGYRDAPHTIWYVWSRDGPYLLDAMTKRPPRH